jgi:hypothetical protein
MGLRERNKLDKLRRKIDPAAAFLDNFCAVLRAHYAYFGEERTLSRSCSVSCNFSTTARRPGAAARCWDRSLKRSAG